MFFEIFLEFCKKFAKHVIEMCSTFLRNSRKNNSRNAKHDLVLISFFNYHDTVQCALCIVHCALCMCVFATSIATFFAYYWTALEFRRVVKHVIGTLSALYWHALSTLSGRCWHVLVGQFWARCAVSTRKISLVQSPPG